MDRGKVQPLRALPRAFVPGCTPVVGEALPLPDAEFKKFHNVLRLRSGDTVAILPNNGTLAVCELDGREAMVLSIDSPNTEPSLRLTLCLALSKPDALEHSVRMASEFGVAELVLFPSRRTVVRWDKDKWPSKLARLQSIAQEAAEVSFRIRLPEFSTAASLDEVLKRHPEAIVFSESDKTFNTLPVLADKATFVVGPEGGWDAGELALVGERAVTLGPRVLRVDTAVAAVCALALANR